MRLRCAFAIFLAGALAPSPSRTGSPQDPLAADRAANRRPVHRDVALLAQRRDGAAPGDAAGGAAPQPGPRPPRRGARRPGDRSPTAERFTLYVPATARRRARLRPAGKFVPPWRGRAAAGRVGGRAGQAGHGSFVTLAGFGNEESVLGRRDPLALIAGQNVLDRYPVDRARVYVAGFSGGAHTAQELALGYPDLFRGALLIAGSDAIGEAHRPPPSSDLLGQYQAGTRLSPTSPARATSSAWRWTTPASPRCAPGASSTSPRSTRPASVTKRPPGQISPSLCAPWRRRNRLDPAKLAGCQAGVETAAHRQAGRDRCADRSRAAGRSAPEAGGRRPSLWWPPPSPRSSEMAARLESGP